MPTASERERTEAWEKAMDARARKDRIAEAQKRLEQRRWLLMALVRLLGSAAFGSAVWEFSLGRGEAGLSRLLLTVVLVQCYGMILLSKRVHELEMNGLELGVTIEFERLPDGSVKPVGKERPN